MHFKLTRECIPKVLKLSSNVSDAFPMVLKLSSEVNECKPLPLARDGRLVCDHLLQLGVVAGDGAQCLVVESIYEFALHVKGRCLTQEAG
jgi:hypothetical protein